MDKSKSTTDLFCSFPACGRYKLAKDLCQTHYWQMRRGEELRPIKFQNKGAANKPCEFAGCERHAVAKGLCSEHRKQQRAGEELRPLQEWAYKQCAGPECDRHASWRGLCATHGRQRMRGVELTPIKPPKFRYVHAGGYIVLKMPDHPNAGKNGNVMEHVAVMSEMLGRPLLPKETVHHIDGNKTNNAPENLELWASRHPKGQRVEDLVVFAREILELYG